MKITKKSEFYKYLLKKKQLGKSLKSNLARISSLVIVLALIALLVQGSPANALTQQTNGNDNSDKTVTLNATVEKQNSSNSKQLYQKDETVYGILNHDGSIQSVEVVNHLYGQAGEWTDYGKYTDLKNLTDDRQPIIEKDTISWESSSGQDLYYQGKIDKKFPWKLEINWKLNDQPIRAEQLAGQSGKAEMHLSVNTEPSASEVYLKYYMLQITVPFKMDKANEIVYSEGGSQIVVGRTRTIAFTLLPGQAGDFTISFDAVNFSMDSIEISALPAGEQSGLDALTTGLNQISSGQQEAADGAKELEENLSAWIDGLDQIAAGLDQAQQGGGELTSGLKNYYQGLLDYQAGLGLLAENADQFGNALSNYATQGPALSQGYAQLALQLNSMQLPPEKLQELQQLLTLPDVLPDGQSTTSLKTMAESLLALNEGITAIGGALDETNQGLLAYMDGSTELSVNYDALLAGIAGLPHSSKELSSGFEKLKTGNSNYFNGVDQLRQGLNESLQQAKPLPGALIELSSAQAEMASGLTQIEEAVSAMLPDKLIELTSFAAPDLVSPQSVQFIATTPVIVEKSVDSDINESDASAKTTFWQRLTRLFK